MEKKSRLSEKMIPILLLFFSIVFVFFNSKNSPLYLFNEWGDVNIYFSVGKGMMNGLVPYRDLFDHKGPLIFFIYGLAYLISNVSFTGVFVLQSIALFINLLFAYKLAKIYLNNLFSFITAIIYAYLLFTKTYYGGSAEEFISVFVTISFYYFILYFRDNQQTQKIINKQMFIHGLMFGLAFLSKLSVCVFWFPLISSVACVLICNKQFKNLFIFSFYFLLGFIATLIPFIFYFALNGALNESYFGYITFNSLYAEFNPGLPLLRKIVVHFYKLTINEYISFPLILLGLFLLVFSKKYIDNVVYRIGILFSFVFSFSLICLSKYIMTYAHIVIYVYAIFGLIFLFDFFQKYVKEHAIIYAVSFTIVLVLGVYNKNFFDQDIDCLLRKKECKYMQKEFADIINKEQNPTLLNIGLDLGVYIKAGLVPSYKYFFYPNIPYHVYPEIRDFQMNLIVNKEPMFVVIGNRSAFYNEYSHLPALKENYNLISTFEQNNVEYDDWVFLYKRKD